MLKNLTLIYLDLDLLLDELEYLFRPLDLDLDRFLLFFLLLEPLYFLLRLLDLDLEELELELELIKIKFTF